MWAIAGGVWTGHTGMCMCMATTARAVRMATASIATAMLAVLRMGTAMGFTAAAAAVAGVWCTGGNSSSSSRARRVTGVRQRCPTRSHALTGLRQQLVAGSTGVWHCPS